MPNDITNEVSFRGDATTIAELITLVKGEEKEFDFNKISPTPPDVFQGPLPSDWRLSGEFTRSWYDHNLEEWGTKWNAYEISFDGKIFRFDTAWSMPHPIFLKLSKLFPSLRIKVSYADEDIGHNCGIHLYRDGEYSEKSITEDWARRLKGRGYEDYEDWNDE